MGFFICALLMTQAQPVELAVMSFNIRYDNPSDGENAWPHRVTWVAQEMAKGDIIGVQEGLSHQVEQLASELSEYEWVGVGRDDGKRAGEFTPIFFKTSMFELLETSMFWLSEDSDQPGSKGWDAALPRIATTAHLIDKRTEMEFLIINTHFDHRGQHARLHSAELLSESVKELEIPVLLLGDLNVTPDSEAYHTLVESEILRDSRITAVTSPLGPEGTFSGFTKQGNLDEAPRIDYIFASDHFKVRTYEAVVSEKNGRYVSDHLPVKVEVLLTN